MADFYTYKSAGAAFCFWTVGMLLGSIWGYHSFGRFWGWDPVEVWAVVTWCVFGIYLHLIRFYGLKRETAAWIYIAAFIISVFTLYLTPLTAGSLHSGYLGK
jgi:ABC-type transport system involved in cytochrome c biogenesis permease subunit